MPKELRDRPRRSAAPAVAGLVLLALALITVASPSRPAVLGPTSLQFLSIKGLNYGIPLGIGGTWLGTSWLRSTTGSKDNWASARPQIAADLDFITRHHLGRVIRVFVGLDQLMNWDSTSGFTGFHEASLENFSTVLSLFKAHGLQMVAVLYDQEEVSSPGNFHFEALDGRHEAMRTAYLMATRSFLERFGSETTIVAWDLFNEAFGSLGPDAGRPRPPAADPVSPNYSDSVVHAFLHDLYRIAKAASPHAWFTVSDGNLYVQPAPDLSRFDDILDFYDVHSYDDHPDLNQLRNRLDKPFIVGEAGASLRGDHLHEPGPQATAVAAFLEQAQGSGARTVLIHSISDQNVFSATHDRLTPAGTVLSTFADPSPTTAMWPIVVSLAALVPFVHRQISCSVIAPDPSNCYFYGWKGGSSRWRPSGLAAPSRG